MELGLFELVRRVKWAIDPSYELKLTSVCIEDLQYDQMLKLDREVFLAPLGCGVRLREV